MKNQDYAQLIASGLPVRFASQQGGRARVYVGEVFEEFMGNKSNARALAAQAVSVRQLSHLGRALRELVSRLDEARHSAAEAKAKVEAKEFAAMIPQAAPKAAAARI